MRTLGLAYKFIPEDSGNDCAELVNEGNMKPRAESLTAESVKLPSSRQALNPKGLSLIHI